MGHNAQANDPCDDPELLEELSALALVECADCGAEAPGLGGASKQTAHIFLLLYVKFHSIYI